MTILTKLEKKDFEKILLYYEIGNYKSHEHLPHALQNTVFILNTTKGKYILKIFEESNPDFIKFQIKVVDYLYGKKIPVAKTLKLKNEKNLLSYKNKKITIQKFIKGDFAEDLNNNLVKNLAKNLALMNEHLSKLESEKKFEWKENHELIPNKDIKNINKIDFVGYEKKLLEGMGTLNRNNLRKSIIHGDFQGRNLLITKNKLEAIVDWDDMHKDYISCEIAVFLMHCFELSNPKNDKKYIELFFKEYQKHLELNEDEKKMIYHLIKRRFLGVIFWFKKQIEIHKDREKKLTKKINRVIKRYLAFEDISLNEFMTLTK